MVVIAELHTAWQGALEHWTEPARHDTLLGLAAKHAQLAWLAGKYRDATWSNPRDPIAIERLMRVRRAAMIMTFSKLPPLAATSRGPLRNVLTLLVGATVATALAFVATGYKVQHQQQTISRHP